MYPFFDWQFPWRKWMKDEEVSRDGRQYFPQWERPRYRSGNIRQMAFCPVCELCPSMNSGRPTCDKLPRSIDVQSRTASRYHVHQYPTDLKEQYSTWTTLHPPGSKGQRTSQLVTRIAPWRYIAAFQSWRHHGIGPPSNDFIMNQERYRYSWAVGTSNWPCDTWHSIPLNMRLLCLEYRSVHAGNIRIGQQRELLS